MRMVIQLPKLIIVIGSIHCGSMNAEMPVAERVSGRDYPSVFQAWSPAEHVKGESRTRTESRHDLIFHAPDFFGLRWDAEPRGIARGFTDESIEVGKRRRAELLELNPNLVLLCEIRHRDAPRSFLSADSDWWLRDQQGGLRVGWEEGGYLLLDDANPSFRTQVAARARAAMDSGVFDGIFLDWWHEDEARIELIREVRSGIGDDALILVNANDRISPQSAPYINGHFMECYRSRGKDDWARIEASLRWAEANLREPRINCLETWYRESRNDLELMRATTALGLTCSDGYVLFSDPNPLPTPDHLHDWYPFWDAGLGKPLSAGVKNADGSVVRRFENGHVVYCPPEVSKTLDFDRPHRRQSTGEVATRHRVGALDGEIFLALSKTDGQGGGE